MLKKKTELKKLENKSVALGENIGVELWFENGQGYVILVDEVVGEVVMTPQTALSLYDWLLKNAAQLERLASINPLARLLLGAGKEH